MPSTFQCRASSYRQFTSEGESSWQRQSLELSAPHTALIVMHAWQPPAPDEHPGWQRAVPYLRQIQTVLRDVFPPLLTAVRARGMAVFHVTGCEAEAAAPLPRIHADPTWQKLSKFREREVFPGAANGVDVANGWKQRRIAPEAAPLAGDGIAETANELHALCLERGINHLIYIGFALNWCLLMSPGGMVDMKRLGYLCSTVAEAVVAVESHESRPNRGEYQQALWRVAVEFGFVFNDHDLIAALAAPHSVSAVPS
jgi:nicotinamidase-related amidase